MNGFYRMSRTLFWSFYQYLKIGNAGQVCFDITSKCNLRCKHCFFFRGNKRKDITSAEWEEIFIQSHKQGYTGAWLMGAEPALRQDIIKLATKYFPMITIVTNGLIKIDDSFRHRIFISLDGTKKTHEKIRGKGSFKKIFENYKNDKRVIFRMCLNKLNYKEIPFVIKLAKEANVGGVSFLFYIKEKKDKTNFGLNKKEIDSIRNIILKEKLKYGTFIYITKSMLDSMISGDFRKECMARHSLAFYSDGERKKKCAIECVDCNECACVASSLQHVFNKDIESFLLALKIYG